MQSKAATVEQYLAELPEDLREAVSAVREVILKNLDKDYVEGMSYGAIGYWVPHAVYPPGYHCDPSKGLPFAGLGSQKNYLSLGIMPVYQSSAEEKWLRDEFAKRGKKLDMGKVCIRFKRAEDLALDVIGEAVRRTPARKFIELYEKSRAENRPGTGVKSAPKRKAGAKKKSAKKAASPKTRARKGKAAKKASRPGASARR